VGRDNERVGEWALRGDFLKNRKKDLDSYRERIFGGERRGENHGRTGYQTDGSAGEDRT